VKEYVRDLSEFMQVVRRTGSVEFGLRSAVRHGGSAKLLLASSGLTQEEVARLEEAARGARGVLVHYAELSPAELGRAAGRQHPVKALAVTALGDADLDRFLESLRDLEASGAVRVIRAARRRER
jgi:ribosomal protein L30E